MGTISRYNVYSSGDLLTAANLNGSLDRIHNLINGGLDRSNVDYSSSDGIMVLDQAQTVTGNKTYNANLTISADTATNSLDVASHNASSAGLKLAGTLVTSTAAELNKLDGVTSSTAELSLLTGITAINDQDDMSGNSATALATQQSIKAYIDTNVTAQDFDFTTTSGSGAVDLDSQALAFTPGEGIDITHSSQAVTFAAEHATDTNKGIASFASADFSVSSGAVSLVDLTTAHLAAATLVTETDTITGNDTDTTIPTSAAVKDYVDTHVTAQDLDFSTTSGNGAVDLDSQALAFTPGEGVDITHSGQAVTIAGEHATTSNKGVASFASADFGVSSGAVSLLATNTTLTTLANVTTVGTVGAGTWAATDVAVAHGGTGGSTASAARTNLGVAVGSDVQAYDAGLASIAGLTTAADKMIYTTGSDTYGVADLPTWSRGLLQSASAAAALTYLGTTIGTDVQAYDAGLASIAGRTTAADKMLYTTGSDTYAVTGLTEIGRNILDDADAAAVRTTIGAQASGTYSTLAYKTVAVSGQTSIVAGAADDTLNVAAGTGITLATTPGTDTLTITNSAVGANAFGTIVVAGQENVAADSTGDTLTFAAGSNITLTTTAGSDTVTIAAGSSGHTIQEEGSGLTARANLNFVGAGVTATDNGSDTTIVTVTPTGASIPLTRADGSSSDPIALTSAALGESLVSDTSPQLGGDLDINGNDIVSDSGNENINITPHGTGSVVISKADINGGAIDGTIIGATTTAAISGTTGTFSGVVTGATLAGTVSTAAQNSITSASSLATVGTIGTGTWEATDIAVAHGGTGASTFAANGILLGNGTSAIAASAELTFDGTDLAIGNAAPSSYISSVHGLVIGDTSDATSEIILVNNATGVGALNFTDTTSTTDHFGWLRFHHTETNHMELGVHQGTHTYFMPGPYAVMGGTDTTNGYMNIGWTLQQQAYDNEILSFKSTDVCHTMTDNQEEDTYGTFTKYAGSGASAGGLAIFGISEGDSGIFLKGQATTKNTTRSTSAFAPVYFAGAGKVGAGSSSIGADGNICVIATGANLARFIFDEEGSAHADVEWTTFSDTRLKKNVVDCPYGLAEVLQLEPKAFDKHGGMIDEDDNVVLEDTPRRMIGFLAQDVKALMPELVKEVDTSKSFYSLNDGKLVAVLVNAIKELNDKLEAN